MGRASQAALLPEQGLVLLQGVPVQELELQELELHSLLQVLLQGLVFGQALEWVWVPDYQPWVLVPLVPLLVFWGLAVGPGLVQRPGRPAAPWGLVLVPAGVQGRAASIAEQAARLVVWCKNMGVWCACGT